MLQQVQPLLDSTNAGSDLVQYIDLTGIKHVLFPYHDHDFLVEPGSMLSNNILVICIV